MTARIGLVPARKAGVDRLAAELEMVVAHSI